MRGTSAPRMLSSQQIESGARQHRRVDTVAGERLGDRLALLLGTAPGEFAIERDHRGERRRRLVGPGRIEGIALDGDQFAPGLGRRLRDALQPLGRVQPGVVAEPPALGQMPGDPGVGRLVGDMLGFEQGRIHLVAHLQGIAAVDEDGGSLRQHHRKPG